MRTLHTNKTYVKKFRLYGTQTTFKFNSPPKGVSEIDWLKKGFSDVVEKFKAETYKGDLIGFTLQSLNKSDKEPGYVSFRPASEVNGDILWEIFGRLIQSNADSVKSTDTFRVQCTRVNLPLGSGRVRPGLYNNFSEECKRRTGIISINNVDNLCLPRALVVAVANVTKDPEYKAIRQDRSNRQTRRAKDLMTKADVVIPNEIG
ncbi:hypothetical protein, partial [Klebsiella pneumoniae]|uniref:hypothetical protein n=1 Tax=Klebsiella pneumoniae TaxID=573 RepID=UPI00117B564B